MKKKSLFYLIIDFAVFNLNMKAKKAGGATRTSKLRTFQKAARNVQLGTRHTSQLVQSRSKYIHLLEIIRVDTSKIEIISVRLNFVRLRNHSGSHLFYNIQFPFFQLCFIHGQYNLFRFMNSTTHFMIVDRNFTQFMYVSRWV